PLDTILPSFRLLETLTERLQGNVGTKKHLLHLISVCTLASTIWLRRARSGSQVNALCGTWVRNLKGLKYWVIVSEAAMAPDWEALATEGDNWLPGEIERLIILEGDDVLLMPPDPPIVHAVHTPVSYLMEGGLL
ncbi:hypothetical protein LTR22_024178, partial [Elasticomyces elasticus]